MSAGLKIRYEQVLAEIEAAAVGVGRNPSELKLVVVTKGHPVSEIEEAYRLGVRDVGENRVAEAGEKQITMAAFKDLTWHMIGHVQSRKAVDVAGHFGLVHSLDSVKLARRMDRFAEEAGVTQDVLLEFNVSGEASKSGWGGRHEPDWPELLLEMEAVLACNHLRVRGLMTMAPYSENPEDARPSFARLRRLRDFLASQLPEANWAELSMGMSGDFVPAIEEGATLLRIGTAVMGPMRRDF